MWDHETIMMIVQGVGETLYMTVLSTVLGYLFGLPMGVLLAVSDKEGLKPNAVLYKILDAIANIVRSIPFLILLILLIPFTRAVVGKSYGSTATVVPLVVAAIPFIARMVESSIKEVDAGVIEAARAMGASNMRIIVKVLLVEARTSLITGALVLGTVGTSVVFAADDDKTITVAASETPHSEILEAAKPILEEEGYDLEVTVFDDYVQPNEVVESGDFDANYFQHIPYLNSFNEEKGTHLVNAGGIHYEPFGIYPGTKSSLDDIADGDTIAVPNDTTNEARALLLLQDNGIIKLKDGAGLEATVNDIEENPYNVEIVELAAEQVARVAEETSYIVLNGNYALQAGYSVSKDALAYETSDSEAAKTYVNVIAVKEGNENSDKIKALVDVLKSDEIKDFINEKYDGAVIPFEDSDDAEAEDTEAADADESADAEADTADEAAEETDAE